MNHWDSCLENPIGVTKYNNLATLELWALDTPRTFERAASDRRSLSNLGLIFFLTTAEMLGQSCLSLSEVSVSVSEH